MNKVKCGSVLRSAWHHEACNNECTVFMEQDGKVRGFCDAHRPFNLRLYTSWQELQLMLIKRGL